MGKEFATIVIITGDESFSSLRDLSSVGEHNCSFEYESSRSWSPALIVRRCNNLYADWMCSFLLLIVYASLPSLARMCH